MCVCIYTYIYILYILYIYIYLQKQTLFKEKSVLALITRKITNNLPKWKDFSI